MAFRIYVDESGTHGHDWFLIGMLFVPDHSALHSALCKSKEDKKYFNRSPKKKARYKEVHFTAFRSRRDVEIGSEWINLFVQHSCYYRSVVIDWSLWDGKYFGDAFDPDALKKRRAYKKWAEMLLQPELGSPSEGQIRNARLYLDKLRIMYGYDVLQHLRSRFRGGYKGRNPYIEEFQHTDSWRDANQCLQLCDLLTGCLYQKLVPSTKRAKLKIVDYLESALKPFGVERLDAGFWKQFAPNTIRSHLPKFSAWFWQPTNSGKGRGRKKRRRK